MHAGIIVEFVYTDDQCNIGSLARRSHQDALGPGEQVRGGLGGGGEGAGRFDDEFDAEFAAGDIAGVEMRDDADWSLVNGDLTVIGLHATQERAIGGVELEEMGIDACIAPAMCAKDTWWR